MTIDPWILTFSAATVIATIWMGFWSAKRSKTASDFFVAGRSVSVGWNASAISGEYLSAASFMGVAGMVMSSGYDALWYPVCYACGYLFLLLFIAGPLRRFGAYTIPDFAEGRFDSPLFRKIAVIFVLFIGFFYTMPQMKGAGTTLAYIFPGLPYWAGVVLVGAVITLNVALGGMKGITLVQAFQYWLKMFAISVPIFVLMTVYGHYGKQLEVNAQNDKNTVRLASLKPGEATPGFIQVTPPYPNSPSMLTETRLAVELAFKGQRYGMQFFVQQPLTNVLHAFGTVIAHVEVLLADELRSVTLPPFKIDARTTRGVASDFRRLLETNGIALRYSAGGRAWVVSANKLPALEGAFDSLPERSPLPDKAPNDLTWLSPFGPLTTKAARQTTGQTLPPEQVFTLLDTNRFLNYRPFHWGTEDRRPVWARALQKLDDPFQDLFSLNIYSITNNGGSVGSVMHPLTGFTRKQVYLSKELTNVSIEPFTLSSKSRRDLVTKLSSLLHSNGVSVIAGEPETLWCVSTAEAEDTKRAVQQRLLSQRDPKPYALLYTYSLIIALVCGTAGLPHILVRFYTNPDGVAAKRTTMWVMILIGVFYLFPPVFGVMGRNLLPDLYAATGAKGTDKVVLELPRILNQEDEKTGRQENTRDSRASGVSSHPPDVLSSAPPANGASRRFPWGSLLSGITCAGAFAAFMSTFSGLLVSMTGALAHDVYGRIFRPKSTPEQRMRMFKLCAVLCGGGAILLGFFVEKFEINKMVGWAFAIAATSYFPLLFLSTWWRGITMKGAATGMLVGGTLSLIAIASTMFADQAAWAKGLADYYAGHPLIRILAEQPAIWALPLALGLMFVVSKLTAKDVPADIRMKMLVLHAPEKLGLKQEYIQEHQQGH